MTMLRIPCACHTECIALSNWTGDGEVELAFWRYGHVGRVGILRRLRSAWKVLRDGTPYADMVVLSERDAARLAAGITRPRQSTNLTSGLTVTGDWSDATYEPH